MENKSAICLGLILAILLSLLMVPIFGTLIIWVEAWVFSKIIGDWICGTLAILGLDIAVNQLPRIAVMLSWIGYFFSLGPVVNKSINEGVVSGIFGTKDISKITNIKK